MKILLVAVNAKYIHSNLAVYSLRAFAGRYADNIKIIELTINHPQEQILREIYREKADIVAFSCYIWNIDIITRVTAELRKVDNNIKIWYGGPEVSYDANQCLLAHPGLDGIMIGEGEQTFLELAGYYAEGCGKLKDIKGIAFKERALISSDVMKAERPNECDIKITPPRELISLDVIPFPYENIKDFTNRIIYYESSRGCPFSCSYCLSSIDKSVRLRDTALVKHELSLLLEARVPQVKFVDRTFNCNKKHAMDIWKFIKEHDNMITNFHFEISADLLTEEEITFLSTLRPGLVQFEIGVQSTNPRTIEAIHRRMDLDKLKTNVAKIREARNIHQHLDLIAGLPYEDITSFEQSFDEVYRMQPDQLQLGFLKVLKGSAMESESHNYGVTYRSYAPYEVLFTNYINYEEVLKIKGICDMVEIYYNSTQFSSSIGFLEHFYKSPFQLYLDISEFYEKMKLDTMAHSRIKRYEILLDFYGKKVLKTLDSEKEQSLVEVFKELLIFDLYLRENLKARPIFATSRSPVENLREICSKYHMDHRLVHTERFYYDVIASVSSGKAVKKETILVFDYANRDPLSKSAMITEVDIRSDSE